MRISTAVLVPALIAVVAVVATVQIREDAVQTTRSTYYAQGLSDGVTRAEARLSAKAPADVAVKINGFCTGTLQLAWFDASMNVTQEQIDAYAATSHECTAVRYLGSLAVSNYAGETGTAYVFVLTMHGKETWWVFTFTAAGLIADVQ